MVLMTVTQGCVSNDPTRVVEVTISPWWIEKIPLVPQSRVQFYVAAWNSDGEVVTRDPLDFNWTGTNELGVFVGRTEGIFFVIAEIDGISNVPVRITVK